MSKYLVILLFVCTAALTASADIIVRDWQFNTPGDNEGWTAGSYQVNNLHVAVSVDGSETVLTCDNLQNQADPKLYMPNEDIELPAGASSWSAYEIRLRQIGIDGLTPVAFDTFNTIGLYGSGGIPNITMIPTASNFAATPPVTVVAQSGQWLVVTWDISAYSGTINASSRVDPIGGTVSGSDILGNFEIDYVTLTAVPEPATTALLACGAMAIIRRKK